MCWTLKVGNALLFASSQAIPCNGFYPFPQFTGEETEAQEIYVKLVSIISQ